MKPRAGNCRQSGNVFFALFGAVALVGAVGASTMSIMKGPVRSMHNVTQRTIAENAMIAAGKLTIMAASQPGGDCDGDNVVEPPGYVPGGTAPHPDGGGLLPSSVGAAKQDPWGNEFGYCVWDHGDAVKAGICADDANRLSGRQDGAGMVVAIISSGPDRIFQTACNAEGSGDYVDKPPGSDDVILSYTYNEAQIVSGGSGLWAADGAERASIQRDIEVTADDGSGPVFAVDNSASGPSMKVDFIQQLSAGVVEFLSDLKGTNVEATGNLNVGGTSTLGAVNAGATEVSSLSADSAAINGTLDVDGPTTLAGLSAGSTSLGATTTSNIEVNGSAVIDGNVTVSPLFVVNKTVNRIGIGTTIPVAPIDIVGRTVIRGAPTWFALTNSEDNHTYNFINGNNKLSILENTTSGSEYALQLQGRNVRVGSDLVANNNIFAYNDLSAGTSIAKSFHFYGETGRVGIGTTTPSTELHVAGGAAITGDASIGGQLDMTGGSIVNMADPTNEADAATKSYVDQRVAAGTGFVEQDPTITEIENGKWCVGSGSSITCTAEPPIGDGDTLAGLECGEGEIPKQVEGEWVCAPDGGDAFSELNCTAGEIAKWDGTQWSCAPDKNDGTEESCTDGGENWTAHELADSFMWRAITYGEHRFVAVAQNGGDHVATSEDGKTWNLHSSPAGTWWDVSYGNGIFVAVGTDGQVMTSAEGEAWTVASTPEKSWRGVTYGNGLFVVVADGTLGDANRVMTSPDGITWTLRSAAGTQWRSVAYGDETFVAVGTPGDANQVMTSPDGVNWTARAAPETNAWYSVSYGNGVFVAVGHDGGVMSSPDGVSWTSQTAAVDQNWGSVTFGGGLFVAVGNSGVMTSADGVSWSAQVPAAENIWSHVAYGRGMFVAVALDGDKRAMSSFGPGCSGGGLEARTCGDAEILKYNEADSEWQCAPDGGDTLAGLECTTDQIAKYNGSEWVCANMPAGGTGGGNDDSCSVWATHDAPEGYWHDVTYGNGLFVAVGSGDTNQVMTSPDGITWMARQTPEAGAWSRVVYDGGQFVAVGYDTVLDGNQIVDVTGWAMTSADGITWTKHSAVDGMWSNLAAGNGRIVATARGGGDYNGMVSQDGGITWVGYHPPFVIQSTAFGDGIFMSVAGNGQLYSSLDGSTWTEMPTYFGTNDTSVVASGDESFFIYTQGGAAGRLTLWNIATSASAFVLRNPLSIAWADAAYGADKWILVGDDAFPVLFISGADQWWDFESAPRSGWRAVAFGAGRFVAVASRGPYRVMSSDGNSCAGNDGPDQEPEPSDTTPPVWQTVETLPAGYADQFYYTIVEATDDSGTVSYTLPSGGPSWLQLDSASGGLTGTPDAPGTVNVTIRAEDPFGNYADRTFSIEIATVSDPADTTPPVWQTPASLPNGIVDEPYSQTLVAADETSSVTFTMQSGLPDGLSFNGATGVLSGTPETNGSYSLTVSASDESGNVAVRVFSLEIEESAGDITPPAWQTAAGLPDGMVGSVYAETVEATDESGSVAFSIVGSPASWITLNPATGAISGTPDMDGTLTVTIRAEDLAGNYTDRTFTIEVEPVPDIEPPQWQTAEELPDATVDEAYTQTLVATDDSAAVTYSVQGATPGWLSLNSATGQLTGTPTVAATEEITVRAEDPSGNYADRTFSIASTIPVVACEGDVREPSSGALYSFGSPRTYWVDYYGPGSATEIYWAGETIYNGSRIYESSFELDGVTYYRDQVERSGSFDEYSIYRESSGLEIGCVAEDGAIYAGDTESDEPMFVAPEDEGSYYWNSGALEFSSVTGATSLSDGFSNTDLLVSNLDGGSPYVAAQACRARGTDWYLPAIEELELMYDHQGIIGGFHEYIPYWSSSEASADEAHRWPFNSNSAETGFKWSNYPLVRCVRREPQPDTTEPIWVTAATLSAGTEDEIYSASVEATDDSGTVTYSVQGSTAGWLSLDEDTGSLGGIASAAGSYEVTIRAEDASGNYVDRTFTIEIEPVPEACETGPVGTECSDGAIYAGESGGHRIYAAPEDEATGITFNNGSANVYQCHWPNDGCPNPLSVGDGLANTNILVGSTDPAAPYMAAETCRAHGNGWYLPSANELWTLYESRDVIGGFTTGLYWTSTTSGESHWIFSQRFNEMPDNFYTSQYSTGQYLRCVRRGIEPEVGNDDTTAPEWVTASLPDGISGELYSAPVEANDDVSGVEYIIVGGAQAWLSLDAQTGVLNGAPAAAGTYSITIKAQDNAGNYSNRSFSLVVTDPPDTTPPAWQTASSLPNGVVGSPYSRSVYASDAESSVTYSVIGTPPAWLSFNPATRIISGTPGSAGSASITIRAQDIAGNYTDRTFSMSVVLPPDTIPPVWVTPENLDEGMSGHPYEAVLSATDDRGAVTYAVQVRYSWMNFNAATGTLSGTPPSAGSYYATIRAYDAAGNYVDRTFYIDVESGPLVWKYVGDYSGPFAHIAIPCSGDVVEGQSCQNQYDACTNDLIVSFPDMQHTYVCAPE